MRRTLLLLLALAACSSSTPTPIAVPAPSPSAAAPSPSPSPGAAFSKGTTLCHLQDPRLTESSGIVSSDQSDHLWFTHNDSGDSARFFAFDGHCATVATYDLRGVTATDVEDIARGPDHVIWLADIGDNGARRPTVQVDRVAEPAPGAPSGTVAATTFTLAYPDGPHDAEALLADPRDGRLFIVDKSYVGRSTLWAAPLPLVPAQTNHLTKVEDVSLGIGEAVTGGDISPDGSQLVLRTYFDAFVTPTRAPGLAGIFDHGPGQPVTIPNDPQGEGIAWTRDGRSLITTSEGRGSAVHLIAPAG